MAEKMQYNAYALTWHWINSQDILEANPTACLIHWVLSQLIMLTHLVCCDVISLDCLKCHGQCLYPIISFIEEYLSIVHGLIVTKVTIDML